MKIIEFIKDGKNKFGLDTGFAKILFKGNICKTRAVKHFDKISVAGFLGKTKNGKAWHPICVIVNNNKIEITLNSKTLDEDNVIYDKKAFFNMINKENWC